MFWTESIAIMVITSSVQAKSTEVKSILDSGGYRGNYAIFLPSFVRRPSSSNADK
jgi:hypothetical protein